MHHSSIVRRRRLSPVRLTPSLTECTKRRPIRGRALEGKTPLATASHEGAYLMTTETTTTTRRFRRPALAAAWALAALLPGVAQAQETFKLGIVTFLSGP